MNMSFKKSTLTHLPEHLQREITVNLKRIDSKMLAMGLEERGGVRHWLRDGQPPGQQLALALRDAPEADWQALVAEARTSGAAIAGTMAARDRAGHELKHKWRSVIAEVRSMVPAGADLTQWAGYVQLANRMLEMENDK